MVYVSNIKIEIGVITNPIYIALYNVNIYC